LALGYLGGREVQRQATDDLAQRALRLTAAVGIVLERRMQGLQVLAEAPALRAHRERPDDARAQLRALLGYTPEFSSIALLDQQGRVLLAEGETPATEQSFGQTDWFARAIERPVATALLQREKADVPIFSRLALPLRGPDGTVSAVLTAVLGERQLQLFRAGYLNPSPASVQLLWSDASGRVLYAASNDAGLARLRLTLPAAAHGAIQLPGGAYLGAYAHIELPALVLAGPQRLSVTALVPRGGLLDSLRALQWQVAAISLAMLVPALALAALLARTLARPVQRLTAAVGQGGHGGQDDAWLGLPQIEPSGYRETRRLGHALRQLFSHAASAHAALEQSRRQLAALSQQLISTEWRARQQLSQRLHDQIGTELSAAKLSLEAAQARGGDALAHATPGVLDSLGLTIACVRDTLNEMRPPLLMDFGLDAALAWEVERRQRDSSAALCYRAAGAPARLPAELEYALFMLVREALANAIVHADAATIHVALQQDADGGKMSIRDDGHGFVGREHLPGHLGLASMRERAAAVGATLQIASELGSGTLVTVQWPGGAAPS
jgi:signal transduction histidine kinase